MITLTLNRKILCERERVIDGTQIDSCTDGDSRFDEKSAGNTVAQ